MKTNKAVLLLAPIMCASLLAACATTPPPQRRVVSNNTPYAERTWKKIDEYSVPTWKDGGPCKVGEPTYSGDRKRVCTGTTPSGRESKMGPDGEMMFRQRR